MGIVFIEGFDHFADTSPITADGVKDYMLGLTPDYISDWFGDAGDSCNITAAESRVAGGKSLGFIRSNTTGGLWADTYGANVGWGFLNKQRITLGFGIKYNKQPDSAIPVAQFRFDEGNGEDEQCSLWISPSGKLFFSSADYEGDIVNQNTPVVITSTATESGAFKFGNWQYLEVFIDYYSGNDPLLTLQVNGAPVIEAVAEPQLAKLTQKYISSAHLINPQNTYFTDGFTQWIDDIYITGDVDGFLGPQQVKALKVDATLQADWSGGGALYIGDFDTTAVPAGVKAGAYGETNIYSVEDLPLGIPKVNAMGVLLYGSAGYTGAVENNDNVGFGLGSGGPTHKKTVTLTGDTRCFRVVFDSLPNGAPMDVTGVNGTNLFISETSLP